MRPLLSIVTISTVGYGDILPVSFSNGRARRSFVTRRSIEDFDGTMADRSSPCTPGPGQVEVYGLTYRSASGAKLSM
jgi:hypothetical protein